MPPVKTMKQSAIWFCLFLAGLNVAGCTRLGLNSAPMDQKFVDTLYASDPSQVFIVNSGGGDPAFGEKATRFIIENDIEIQLEAIFLSSCAEYILPAANNISVTEQTLIGFHQNPMMIRHFADEGGYADSPICYYEDEIPYLTQLHAEKLANSAPWEIVRERVGPT